MVRWNGEKKNKKTNQQTHKPDLALQSLYLENFGDLPKPTQFKKYVNCYLEKSFVMI